MLTRTKHRNFAFESGQASDIFQSFEHTNHARSLNVFDQKCMRLSSLAEGLRYLPVSVSLGGHRK
jgi:hypothetical protein